MLSDIPEDALQQAYDESLQRVIRANLDADAAENACYVLHERLMDGLLRKAGIAEGTRVTVAFLDGIDDRFFVGFVRDWRTQMVRIKLASVTKRGKPFKQSQAHKATMIHHMKPAKAQDKQPPHAS